MAEANDSISNGTAPDTAGLTRRNRDRRPVAERRATGSAPRPAPTAPKPSRKPGRPVRSLAIFTVVGGLVATVALPAYGALRPSAEAVTLQQVAAGDAQSLLVASDAVPVELSRGSYAATTQEEIDKKKAQEAAAARAAELANTVASLPVDLTMVSPGSGEVRWPLLTFTQGRGLWDSGYHQGVDLLAPAMTPIYAAAAGVVRVSTESYSGYGVAITIDHVIGGQQVNTLYGHMTYGTRQVEAGQTVEAGQLIGFVGSTGSSTANHCHFEVHINGSVVDPWAWLVANAG
ncbi:M23 family metallopeptidase [Microbacterium sp. BWT-B31]|uniref:M23 family metallopeptidase n=1 Tax=Microbacterium sp. BWT-B31 TaxID=3232072 RepID=UPI003528BF88